MKRKYSYFMVETENDTWGTSLWRSAFSAYQRSESCTIYGLPNHDGANYEVIMSK